MSDSDEWEEAPKPTAGKIINSNSESTGNIKNSVAGGLTAKSSTDDPIRHKEEDLFQDIFNSSAERGLKQKELQRQELEKEKEAIRTEREIVEVKVARKYEFGDKGSNWRMMKLKRVYESAKEEGLTVEDVARERYATQADWLETLEERKWLDEQRNKNNRNRDSNNDRGGGGGAYRAPMKRSEFKAPDRSSSYSNNSNYRRNERNESQQHFRPKDSKNREDRYKEPSSSNHKREREEQDSSDGDPIQSRTSVASGVSGSETKNEAISTPAAIPVASTATVVPGTQPVLTTDQLNKLYSKVLKARLMKSKNLQTLEDEYEYEKHRSETQPQVVVLPTLDADGKLQDFATHGNKQQAKKMRTDTHDEKGNRLSYLDENQQSLTDLVRHEKMQKGISFDKEMAIQISKDARFKNNLDYADEASERLSKERVLDQEKMKRNAIREHQRVESILHSCNFCYKDDAPPKVSVIATGLKSYLALPETVDMVPYHCLIVPIQHVSSTLELEDDVWDEIRNFKKSLIRMFEKINRGVLFMEQVMHLKRKVHTVIECIPVPLSVYQDATGYFKEALMEVEGEWTQHKPIIDTDRGFRKSMVQNLPYFHIWFDPNRGYGHVIEDTNEWPSWFGKEVIASALDLPPNLWRKPRRIESREVSTRNRLFIQQWEPFDWTKMLYT